MSVGAGSIKRAANKNSDLATEKKPEVKKAEVKKAEVKKPEAKKAETKKAVAKKPATVKKTVAAPKKEVKKTGIIHVGEELPVYLL